jgi:hypothetical protein
VKKDKKIKKKTVGHFGLQNLPKERENLTVLKVPRKCPLVHLQRLKTKIHLNYMQYPVSTAQRIFRLHYQEISGNTIQGNNRSLFTDTYETHQYNVYARRRVLNVTASDTHTHTRTNTIYMYTFVCVCVCGNNGHPSMYT